MDKIILKESEFKSLIRTIVEAMSFGGIKSKKTAINYLHKVINPYTTKMFTDKTEEGEESWKGVRIVQKAIASIDGITDLSVSVENGGYRENSDGVKWKEYNLEIETIQGFKIFGILNAHAAGTVEDPFSRYDITVNFW